MIKIAFAAVSLCLFCIPLPAQEPGSSARSGGGQNSGGQETQPPSPPRMPLPPLNPLAPVDPGGRNVRNDGTRRPELPAQPSPAAGNEQVRAVENRVFAAAGVFPGGDRSGPVTGSVNGIFYTAYSDQSRSFVVVFNDGPSYTYLLRNPRGAIQMGPNEWRISYDVIIQAGTEIIPGFFTAEAYYNNGRPLSFTIINSAAASVVVIIDLKP